MAGAAPGRTQQLLERSLQNRQSHSLLTCGKGNLFLLSAKLNLKIKNLENF